MKELTWPLAAVVVSAILATAGAVVLVDDAQIRGRMADYFGTIMAFIVGGGVGATAGTLFGYARAKGLI